MIDKSKIKIKSATPPDTALPHKVYKIKVDLKGAPYPTWRILLIDADDTISDLMRILLTAMGWDFSHLYSLYVGRDSYVDYGFNPDYFDGIDGDKYKVSDILGVGTKARLVYDFGDNWLHTVTVQEILPDCTFSTPFCVRGKGACPPDDSGGVYGFADKLETLEHPDDPYYEDFKEWLGDFDPNDFYIDITNSKL